MTTAKKPVAKAAAPKKKVATRSHVEEKIEYEIGIRELRQDASRVIALVESGASFTITRHGKAVATINPPKEDLLETWIREGKATPAKRKFDIRNWKPTAEPAPKELWGLIERERAEARY